MCTTRHVGTRNIKPNFKKKKNHKKSLGCHCKSAGEIDKIRFHAMVIKYSRGWMKKPSQNMYLYSDYIVFVVVSSV